MRKIIYEYNHLLRMYRKFCRKLQNLRSANRNERRQFILQKHITRLHKKLSVLNTSIKLTTATAAAVIGSFVFAPSANAQVGFAPKQINPFNINDINYYSSPAFADIDGDGDLDMITGDFFYTYNYYYGFSYENRFKYYENIGTNANPDFAAPVVNPFGITGNTNGSIDRFAPTFVDLDGDGDLDLVYGERNANFYYLENTGSATAPAFGAPQLNPFALSQVPGGYYSYTRFSTPTFADLDADGDLDLIAGNNSGDFFYFENIGNSTAPAFSGALTNPFNLTGVGYYADSAPVLVDMDGDGDFDLLSGNDYGEFSYFENTGTSSAPDFGSQQSNPFNLTFAGSSYYYGSLSRPSVVDLDNDGDFDIMAGDRYGDFTYFRQCTASTETLNVTSACGYTSPGGQFYSTSGIYNNILINSEGCDSTIIINLTIVPIQDQTVTAANPTLCGAGSTTIDLGSSQNGVNYYLRDDSDNSIVAGPIVGNGSSISLPTGTISSTTTYNVYADKTIQSTGLEFDGSNDYVSVPGINIANSSFSIEFWAQRETANTQDHVIGQGTANGNDGLHIGFRGNNVFTFAFFGNDLNTVNTFTDNSWHHYAVTYNATTGDRIIYVDGALEVSDNTSNQYTGTGNMIIGDTPWGNDEFGGSVDELRIWSTVRTQTEIADNMSICLSGTESGLTAYYQFEDGVGSSTLADATTNHDGTLTNMDVNNVWLAGVSVCATCDLPLTQTATVTVMPALDLGTTLVDLTITSNQAGATYQWLDCNNGNAPISGETNQSFTATANGNYAVEISMNGCTDTSNCVAILSAGLSENGEASSISVYPNPSADKFIMVVKKTGQTYRITDNLGKVIAEGVTTNTQTEIDLSAFADGIYLLNIDARFIKLIKQ